MADSILRALRSDWLDEVPAAALTAHPPEGGKASGLDEPPVPPALQALHETLQQALNGQVAASAAAASVAGVLRPLQTARDTAAALAVPSEGELTPLIQELQARLVQAYDAALAATAALAKALRSGQSAELRAPWQRLLVSLSEVRSVSDECRQLEDEVEGVDLEDDQAALDVE